MFDRTLLDTLAAVLRHGAFDRAAAALGVTPPAVSQRIRALEEAAGGALVTRGQPCTATPLGLRLARHAEDLRLLDRELASDLGLSDRPERATLRIAVNADSLATWVLPALAKLPETIFDVVVDDENHSAEWLRRGEVVAAVTESSARVPGCDAVDLGRQLYRATAAPEFARRWFPQGVTAKALAQATCLTFGHKDRIQRDWITALTGRTILPPTHFLPSPQAFADATVLGMGWGMNPAALVDGHITAGRLVDLAPEQPWMLPLAWQVTRRMSAALKPLTRAMRETARERLLPA